MLPPAKHVAITIISLALLAEEIILSIEVLRAISKCYDNILIRKYTIQDK